MKRLKWFQVLALAGMVAVSPKLVYARDLSKSEQEKFFLKGVLGSCRADLKRILDSGTSHNPKETPKEAPIELESCNQKVTSRCRLDLEKTREPVSLKSKFFGDQLQSPSFSWDHANKKLYTDIVLRKLCSGAISQASLKDYDALFFLNTECTGSEYLHQIDRLQALPNIDSERAPKICHTGANVTAKFPISGKEYLTRFLVINPTSRFSGLYEGENAIDYVSLTLVHEFAHHQRSFDPTFKAWTDEFLELRFAKIQKQYLKELDKIETDINTVAQQTERIYGLNDSERNQRIAVYANDRITRFRDWLVANRIPVRHGLGSRIGSWVVGKIDEKPGSFEIEGLPTFKNGKASKFIFGDHVRNNGHFSIWVLDSYALKNKEEYLAIAFEIFWHNRSWAEWMFAEKEIEFLEKKWRHGYIPQLK